MKTTAWIDGAWRGNPGEADFGRDRELLANRAIDDRAQVLGWPERELPTS